MAAYCEHCMVSTYNNLCKCMVSGEVCPFVRRCTKELIWKPLDSMFTCKLKKEGKKVPTGKNKILFCLHNELYVDMGNMVISVPNIYDNVPDYVEIIKYENEYYIKGTEPQVKKKSKVKEDVKDAVEEE